MRCLYNGGHFFCWMLIVGVDQVSHVRRRVSLTVTLWRKRKRKEEMAVSRTVVTSERRKGGNYYSRGEPPQSHSGH